MNEISVTERDLNEMCRLCLTKDSALIDIFYFSDELESQLSNVIMTLAPVQIRRHDEIPNYICRLCYTQLKTIHKFQVQIVESDKTLRQYLQQLRSSDQQIKSELSIQNSSEEHNIHKTNHSDVTEKFESVIFHDIFGTTHTDNEVAPLNCNSANKLNEEIPLKSEIRDEPTDDNSSNLIECANDIVELVYMTDNSEMCTDNSKGHISGSNVAKCLDRSEEDKKDIALNYKNQTKTTEKKNFCNICNKSFKKMSTFKTHMSIHTVENPYQCDVCNKNFSIRHTCTHTKKKPYQCDVCDKSFDKLFNLKKHKRTHTGEKPHQCDVCDKSFASSSNLVSHKRIHTGEKPYKCDVCNMCFNRSGILNRHKRIHTQEKPYHCDVCDRNFSLRNSLNDHKRTHTGEKPYQCDVCNKCYSKLSSLNVHKRTHTA